MLHLTESDAKASVAKHLAIAVYEKIEDRITGITYSKDEKDHLRALKDIYKAALKVEPPVIWNLDEKDQPTHRIKSSDVATHIEQRRHDKSSLGPFHYYIDGILEFASTYLKERGERGALTRGKPGDVLEQFLTELIHWGVNDLPTYAANAESVTRLKQRIDYLDKILKAENLFKFGTFTRGKNKTETITNIKQTLEACLQYAEQEAQRLNARDKLTVLKLETERLLLGCVNTLYYVRATPVHTEPLRLELFLQPATATAHLGKIYRGVQATHSGAMLQEVIHLAGVDSFGGHSESKAAPELKAAPVYFNRQGQRQLIPWQARKMDLPPWVIKENASTAVAHLQSLGEATLRVAKLKMLIESAYDLTGKAGDLWAYGDEQGKASLEALLHLLSVELEQLIRLLNALHAYHDGERRRYNLVHRIDQDKGANPNFNKFDHHFIHCTESHARLSAAIDDITKQMRAFPADASKRVNEQKQRFYRDLAQYMQAYHPDVASRFPGLVSAGEEAKAVTVEVKGTTPLHAGPAPVTATEEAKVTPVVVTGLETSLRLPITQAGPYVILHLANVKATPPPLATDPVKVWQVGDEYADWVTGFMTRQAAVVTRYQTTADTLLDAKAPTEAKQIEALCEQGKQALTTLAQTLEETRPKWRFQWSFWPFKTVGWPFNKAARGFAEALNALLSQTLAALKQRAALLLATAPPAVSLASASPSSVSLGLTPAPTPLTPLPVTALTPEAPPISRTATTPVPSPAGITPGAPLAVSATAAVAAVAVSTPAPTPTLVVTPLTQDYKPSLEEEQAEKELNAYIEAKSEHTVQQHLFSRFMRELNCEFENPRQTHFEMMALDLRRERVLRLLAVETLSTAMQKAVKEDISPLLAHRCQSPRYALSVCYRRQAALVLTLLKACTTTEPAAKAQSRKECLREFDAYVRYQTTHALVAVRDGATTPAHASSPVTATRVPTPAREGITHA